MPFVDATHHKLWFQETGDRAGTPIVLSGGFGLLHNQWDYVREGLAKELRVIDWNYRGAGQSDRAWPGGAFHQDTWVDDLECVLDHLQIKEAILWGTSTGSPITIRYATRFPRRVKAIITYPMFKADAGFRQAFDAFGRVGETFGYEALAALTSWIGVAQENLFTAKWGELAKWEAGMFRANFGMDTLVATMNIVSGNDFTSDLAKITVPALVLMGKSGNLGYDTAGNRALADEFMRRVPHAKLAVIARAGGTYCMIEEPEATNAAVLKFIRNL